MVQRSERSPAAVLSTVLVAASSVRTAELPLMLHAIDYLFFLNIISRHKDKKSARKAT
jgi:hypothetical protein